MALKKINEYYTLTYSTESNANVVYFKFLSELKDFVNVLTSSFAYSGPEVLSLIARRKIVSINTETHFIYTTSEEVPLWTL